MYSSSLNLCSHYVFVSFTIRCDYLLCYLCGSIFFFFFKQKTAYEMRISDWSSDVCSSDLRVEQLELARRAVAIAIKDVEGLVVEQAPAIALPVVQIGRASCRERVCQYV